MEQKKNQKDVLIVRDEKTGEISVVAGLKRTARRKRLPLREPTRRIFCCSTRTATRWTAFWTTFSGNARSRNASASTVWRRRTSSM